MSKTLSLIRADRKYLWHPFTQQREWERGLFGASLVIARAKGVWLSDAEGRKYLDGVSSLWANLHGHRHPAIDKAVSAQLKKMAHSTFLGLTHEPAIRFAEELVRNAPKGLRRVFFSDNGSTAVEVALKMAFQFHAQKSGGGPRRTEFLALRNAYHGDTLGSVSVGGIGLFHKKFKPLLFKTHWTLSPHCLRCPHNRSATRPRSRTYRYRGENPAPGDARPETGCRWQCLGDVESVLRARGRKIAAAVIEPVVQGAGGILVMPPGYVRGYARLCKKYGVPLILDEVAVGFGRTGTLFACEQEGVTPDLLCLSKGISGGYLPLAATLATEKIYRAFLGAHADFKTFFHGHTYTANPLACAAARASLKIFRDEKTILKTQKLSRVFGRMLSRLEDIPAVGQVRRAGMMAGVEIVKNRATLEPFPVSFQAGKKICLALRREKVFLRPLGDVLVLMPPLSIREKELRFLVNALHRTLLAFSRSAA